MTKHFKFAFNCPRCGGAMTLDEDDRAYVCLLCSRAVTIRPEVRVRLVGEPRRGDRSPRAAGVRL